VKPTAKPTATPKPTPIPTVAGYYRFESGIAGEGMKTVVDSSANRLSGTVVSNAEPAYNYNVPNKVVPLTGATDRFSGYFATDDIVRFGYPFPFEKRSNATLQFWIYPLIASEADVFWTTSSAGDKNRFIIGYNSNKQPFINYKDSAGTLHALGTGRDPLTPGQWSFLAFVKAGSTYTIYQNDNRTAHKTVLESTVVDKSPKLPTGTQWFLNGRAKAQPSLCCQFGGYLDEILISNVGVPASGFLVAAPSPSPTPPVVSGDVFHYAEKDVDTVTQPGSPPQVSASSSAYTIAVSGNATFAGKKNLTKLTYSSSFTSPGTTLSEYVGFTQSGQLSQERLYGALEQGAQGSLTTTAASGEIEDELPEAAGQKWNVLATTVTLIKATSNHTRYSDDDIEYADGSYANKDSRAAPGDIDDATFVLASDGSGTTTNAETGYYNFTFKVGLPVGGAGRYVIPVTTAGGNQPPGGPTPPKTVDVTDWYPTHHLPNKPLHTFTITDEGKTTTPAGCGSARTAFRLHGVEGQLDPLAGQYETTIYDQYDAPGLGNVCSIETDTTYLYDNSGSGELTETDKNVSTTVLIGETGPKPLVATAGAAGPALFVDLHSGHRLSKRFRTLLARVDQQKRR
jgi:hypothetical protein